MCVWNYITLEVLYATLLIVHLIKGEIFLLKIGDNNRFGEIYLDEWSRQIRERIIYLFSFARRFIIEVTYFSNLAFKLG